MAEMSIVVRRGDDRGLTRTSWLLSRHSFSFNEYVDLTNMQIGALRVLNDDGVEPGHGFPEHPHRDAEIVSYVTKGALAHRDSEGNEGVVRAGEAQFMRAGRGVTHREWNASDREPVHFFQVWFIPRRQNLAPTYAKRKVEEPAEGWTVIAAPDRDHFGLDCDATMEVGRFPNGRTVDRRIRSGRVLYLFVVDGELRIEGETLHRRDAATVWGDALSLDCLADARLLLFDLARE
ncbi:MAG: pirin family protein [Methanobacteriota archaeon]